MTARKAGAAARIDWLGVVLPRARAIVASYDTPVTLRQLHYRLVAAGVIPNERGPYQRLSDRTATARRRGTFPDLLDLTRELYRPPGWASPAAFLDTVADAYARDRSGGQPVSLWVAAEKDTLRVQVQGWLDGLGVHLAIGRGYASQTYVAEVAAAMRQHRQGRERTVLLYVGDLDASGEDVEADLVGRLRDAGAIIDHHERVALTMGQVRADAIPPAVGKATDTRWPTFAGRHGLALTSPVQWEVEALDPAALRALVLAAVEPHVDRDQLAAVKAEEDAEAERLAAWLATWPPDGDRSPNGPEADQGGQG